MERYLCPLTSFHAYKKHAKRGAIQEEMVGGLVISANGRTTSAGTSTEEKQ